jgi:diaminohydroxyphosphoribosylaminopyrimidine deaminase/5-amino-6-(5-phosphoribosylamino)uracil reductase
VTTPGGASRADARKRLESCGAEIEVAPDRTFAAALGRLGARQIGSLLLEGGAALHRAAWEAGVVDFVRLYVTPQALGSGGVPFLDACSFSWDSLVDGRVEPLGPDVLVEGYVHRPH